MEYIHFYKNRLELSLIILESLLLDEDFAIEYISNKNKEKLEQEIVKKINNNYLDPEVYELKMQLEVLHMFENFKRKCHLISTSYNEHEIMEEIFSIENYIRNQEQKIHEQLYNFTFSKDWKLMELAYQSLRKDYQELFLYKEFRNHLVSSLEKFDTSTSRLAGLFHLFF